MFNPYHLKYQWLTETHPCLWSGLCRVVVCILLIYWLTLKLERQAAGQLWERWWQDRGGTRNQAPYHSLVVSAGKAEIWLKLQLNTTPCFSSDGWRPQLGCDTHLYHSYPSIITLQLHVWIVLFSFLLFFWFSRSWWNDDVLFLS